MIEDYDQAFNANFLYLTEFDTRCNRHVSVSNKSIEALIVTL